MAARQHHSRQSLVAYMHEASTASVLTAPVVYSLIVPLGLLDLWTTLYQLVCFPVYGVPRVARRPYFVLDRSRLAYLNGIEKTNCLFCSYANGLVGYVREVAARTEQYWCPIKHAGNVIAPHARYPLFVEYGDAEAYRRDLSVLRESLQGDASVGPERDVNVRPEHGVTVGGPAGSAGRAPRSQR